VQQFFLGSAHYNFLFAPALSCLFYCTYIKYAIAEIVVDLFVWFLSEEGFVCMDTIASKKCCSTIWDILLDIGKERFRSFLGGGGGSEDCCC
jgi:hypothetical protein